MGLYAFFLAGSNYFAPVICGFIAQYQGWQWVFYWPSIFAGCGIVLLFFFMEETNYVRENVSDTTANVRMEFSKSSENVDLEKTVLASDESARDGSVVYTKKTYLQRLSLLGPKQQQNTMFRQLWQTLYYLSWPVIFYAGYISPYLSLHILDHLTFPRFSYGSYLVLFNILNDTSSIILSGKPYNFG